jgi:hypothetical protein
MLPSKGEKNVGRYTVGSVSQTLPVRLVAFHLLPPRESGSPQPQDLEVI